MDPVEVSFHPDTYDRYFKPLEVSHPGFLDALLSDFRRYQQSMREELPDYFGYDSEYGHPPEIAGCIEHIHLCIPPRSFPARKLQIDRKCRKGDPDNDIALVYARGLYEPHRFCIIGILMPGAHTKHHNRGLMLELGAIGRRFKNDN